MSRWVNIADRNHVVAARPDLTDLFSSGKPSTAALESSWKIYNGAQPHTATFYLTKKEVGDPIATAISIP